MDCVCKYHNLEQGDTLYKLSSWDGGMDFEYIYDIQYCPVCGKKLPNFNEEEEDAATAQ